MDRFTLGVAAGVLALVAAGLVTAFVLRTAPAPDLGTPHGVVLAYALAEDRGDGATAWDLLAASTQARTDRDRYLARVSLANSAGTSEYLSTEDEQIGGNDASVVLVRTHSGSGSIFGSQAGATRTTVRLTRDPTGWRITVPPDEYNLVSLTTREGAGT